MNVKKLIRFDWAIKTILRNKKNFSILEGFLSELLGEDVKIQELLESESNKNHAKDKFNRVDVLAKLGEEQLVIIEVQCEAQSDFLSRMLYGVSKVVVQHLQAGERYREIPRVISVNIVYFDLGQGEDYIYRGRTEFKGIHKNDILQLHDSEKKHYPTKIDHISNILPEYYVLKVGAFNLDIRNTLDEWMYALKKSEVKPEFKARGIQEAGEKLSELSLSQEERLAYERYVDNARNARSTIETAYEEGATEGLSKGLAKGLAKGRAEGEMKAKIDMMRNLHQLGISIEQIARGAELSKKEVEAILESGTKMV